MCPCVCAARAAIKHHATSSHNSQKRSISDLASPFTPSNPRTARQPSKISRPGWVLCYMVQLKSEWITKTQHFIQNWTRPCFEALWFLFLLGTFQHSIQTVEDKVLLSEWNLSWEHFKPEPLMRFNGFNGAAKPEISVKRFMEVKGLQKFTRIKHAVKHALNSSNLFKSLQAFYIFYGISMEPSTAAWNLSLKLRSLISCIFWPPLVGKLTGSYRCSVPGISQVLRNHVFMSHWHGSAMESFCEAPSIAAYRKYMEIWPAHAYMIV